MTRKPDWESAEFWEWAVKTCQAAPFPLSIWFPEASRQGWDGRKRRAAQMHQIAFPKLSRSNRPTFPDDPPDGWKERDETQTVPPPPRNESDPSGELLGEVEWKANGECRSARFLRMTEAQSKDPAYLLEAHGFDVCEWDIISAKNKIWQVFSKNAECGHDVSTLYSSHITARPLESRFDPYDILSVLCAVEPVQIPTPKGESSGLLELPFHDLHFGVSTLETYRPTLERAVRIIRSRTWDRIVVPVGSDTFHNDNFRATTAKGTPIEGMDWPSAYADATAFFSTVIEESLAHAKEVLLVYVRSNHDESMSWLFCHVLDAKYPRLECDLEIVERKVVSWEGVCIGLTHGGKSKACDLDRLFRAEFPAFNAAEVKEIHTGHEHHEESQDRYGVLVRKAPSGNVTDSWHQGRGFVGAVKRFIVYRYSPGWLEGMDYV